MDAGDSNGFLPAVLFIDAGDSNGLLLVAFFLIAAGESNGLFVVVLCIGCFNCDRGDGVDPNGLVLCGLGTEDGVYNIRSSPL